MNRILFIPLNRQLLYFYKRALFKGHLPFFKWNPGGVREGFRSENFVDHRELCNYFPGGQAGYKSHMYWQRYLASRKITHIVTNVEDNKKIIDCFRVANGLGTITSYIMHGGGKIYDPQFLKDWYTSGIYDYFYAKDEYTKNSLYGDKVKARKWVKQLPRLYGKGFEGKPKKVMFVPSQTSPEWFLEGSGVYLTNHEKYKYQLSLLKTMEKRKNTEFLWCHDDTRDAVPNEMIKHLAALNDNVEWVIDRPESYFKKVDACMTDVGSSFFFNAIRAGKPVLCLHHIKRVPFKLGTAHLLGRCVQLWQLKSDFERILNEFLDSPMKDYIPTKYIEAEQRPNDPLVWEER
jgi:hypothetical protein